MDEVYKSDSTFFGEEPSIFALLCLNQMKTNNIVKLLDLGAGHGRDSIFFASMKGIEVEALDYSVVAVQILDKIRKEKRLPIKPQYFVKNPLPFPNGYFDAVYSHMLLNMRFSLGQLHFIFSEIRSALEKVLTEDGFVVDSYEHPLVALDKFKPHLYNLVVLDIRMPELNGFALYREIRKLDKKVKICFLTAGEMYYGYSDIFSSVPANYFIRKPIENQELMDHLNAIIADDTQVT